LVSDALETAMHNSVPPVSRLGLGCTTTANIHTRGHLHRFGHTAPPTATTSSIAAHHRYLATVRAEANEGEGHQPARASIARSLLATFGGGSFLHHPEAVLVSL
jgi:hypothetical protein